jgi:trans-aconitate 2-methyltransferase
MSWDPGQYLKYASERLRPALDLMARVPLAAPRSIVDLGCGAGNVTRILAERWPGAAVTGIDRSTAMLAAARSAMPPGARVEFQEADLAAWSAAPEPATADLVYSNAALHWLDDHRSLFPRLLDAVAPGGVLAAQMPSNFAAPSHAALHDTVASPRWRAHLLALLRPAPVASAAEYFEWLAPRATMVDAWTTEYLHVLPRATDGDHPVVAWTRGTALTPFLAELDADAQRAFVGDYAARIAAVYPLQPDGRVLFPFRRVFVVVARANR